MFFLRELLIMYNAEWEDRKYNVKKRRKTPYVEIDDDMPSRLEDTSDKQMGDLVDTILIMVINGIDNAAAMQLELMKCGFKISMPTLNQVINCLDAMGIIERERIWKPEEPKETAQPQQ